MLLHQSDLAAWNRCAAEYGYRRQGLRGETNSAAAYGSVMHHAIQVFERVRIEEGFDVALQKALETFAHYWNPMNIEAICPPVPANGWLPRQGYSELLARGKDAIRKYADLIKFDDHELLATEFTFYVPVQGTWDNELNEPHYLAGSVDRLASRFYARALAVCVDDYKTGREYKYLRQNLQFTAYCYATTQREFWVGNGGEDGFGEERGNKLFERFMNAGRRGTWINMRTFKFQDAGWRGPKDYARLALAFDQIAMSIQADIFPLTLSGESCTYCSHRDVCGGTGVAPDDHGKPVRGG